jgi:hypothetical protein
VRVQQSRSGFRKMRFYFSAVVQHKITGSSQKKKVLLQQNSCDPCQSGFIARVQQSRSGLKKIAALFQCGLLTQNNREVTKNKAALSTKICKTIGKTK